MVSQSSTGSEPVVISRDANAEVTPGSACRLLIVDDHRLFRQALRALLSDRREVVVVGEAANGIEALEKARELAPDVILMDIQMPGCDGLEATSRIRQELPQAKVVVLTAHGNEPTVVYEAIKAGAMGYVSKHENLEDVINAISLVSRGQAALASLPLTSLVNFIVRSPETAGAEARTVDRLSAREQEVLDLVAQGNSNREIAERLYISESTVRSHLHNILDKLRLTNRVQAATFAHATRQAKRNHP